MSVNRILPVICQAHPDPVWQWPWRDGVAEGLTTPQSAVDGPAAGLLTPAEQRLDSAPPADP